MFLMRRLFGIYPRDLRASRPLGARYNAKLGVTLHSKADMSIRLKKTQSFARSCAGIFLRNRREPAQAQLGKDPSSKKRSMCQTMLWTATLLFCLASVVNAQPYRVTIRVSPGQILIEGACPPTSTWSFKDSYAGVLNLGSRIEGLKLRDSVGANLAIRKIAPGQFEAPSPAIGFQYQVVPGNVRPADEARVSWVDSDRGLLMLGDLLPVWPAGSAVGVRLILPPGWLVHSNQLAKSESEFELNDFEHAVIAVGPHLRITNSVISGLSFTLVADGQWAFTDAEALDLAARVLKAHRDVFDAMPSRRATLILFPSAAGGAPDRWNAETRGSSVTLMMGKLPSKVAALAMLSTPLTHEFLHFWVPNGLALTGDYDWFYEGFTVYQAARTGVRLGLLTFPEFLNAIARAYDGYAIGLDRDRWSLIEASQRRFTGGGSAVYSKSMLVALIFDLNLRSKSHNKHSLDDVYRSVYRAAETNSHPADEEDGSAVVLKALSGYSYMRDFGSAMISNLVTINLEKELAPFGLLVEKFGLRSRISVNASLNRQQRDLLHDLGYNDFVRSPRPGKTN
jgi:hypothetical protein